MRKLLRVILIFVAGVGVGVLATLGVQWIAALKADIQRDVSLSLAPYKQVTFFIAKNHRPPKDVEELAS